MTYFNAYLTVCVTATYSSVFVSQAFPFSAKHLFLRAPTPATFLKLRFCGIGAAISILIASTASVT